MCLAPKPHYRVSDNGAMVSCVWQQSHSNVCLAVKPHCRMSGSGPDYHVSGNRTTLSCLAAEPHYRMSGSGATVWRV